MDDDGMKLSKIDLITLFWKHVGYRPLGIDRSAWLHWQTKARKKEQGGQEETSKNSANLALNGICYSFLLFKSNSKLKTINNDNDNDTATLTNAGSDDSLEKFSLVETSNA